MSADVSDGAPGRPARGGPRRGACQCAASPGTAGASPREPRLERPKRGGQGDYSTNAAMLLAPVLGAPPREIAERLGEALAERARDGARPDRGRRAGVPEPVPRRRLAPRRAARRCCRPASGSARAARPAPSGSWSSSSPRTRPARWWRPAAATPPTATRWRGSSSTTATRSPASTTSTTPAGRSAGSASRCGRARAARRFRRTAIRATTSPMLASQIPAPLASVDVDALGGARRRAAARPDQGDARALRRPVRQVLQRAGAARGLAERRRARDGAAARRPATLYRSDGACGCGRRRSATTRIASSCAPTASRPTSPPTSRTCSTSATAASSGSC